MRKNWPIAAWLTLLLTAPLARAELPADFDSLSPEAKGLAIAEEADRRDTGWENSTADMEMVLRNARGDESTREIHVMTLEVADDGDKSLIIFDEPADVKGTAFLSFTHATRPDDQWLYLPALKRVKRIASANKSGPFMGSEFAYEDLTSQEVEKYSYKYLRDEDLDGRATWVVERYPAYENSGYTRQVTWIDKAMFQPLKVIYYDRKDARLKTLELKDYQQYLDRYWRAGLMSMVNHQTKKSTDLIWSDYRFRQDINERNFEPNALKRLR